MKTTTLQMLWVGFLSIFFVCYPTVAAEVHTNIAGIDITVEAQHSSFPSDTDIILLITTTNGTGQSVHWTEWGPRATDDCACAIGAWEVVDLLFGTNMPCRQGPPVNQHTFHGDQGPGGTFGFYPLLKAFYGLANSGMYSVRFIAHLPTGAFDGSGSVVPMAPLIITISNRPPSDSWDTTMSTEDRGKDMDGWQIIARMPRREFTLGDAIPLVVLLQNTTTNSRPMREPMTQGSMCEFIVKSEDGHTVPIAGSRLLRAQEAARDIGFRTKQNEERYGWFDVSIPAHGQRWYDYRLDQWFAIMSPGTYTLEARLLPPPSNYSQGKPMVNMPQLICGPISFKVVASSTSASKRQSP